MKTKILLIFFLFVQFYSFAQEDSLFIKEKEKDEVILKSLLSKHFYKIALGNNNTVINNFVSIDDKGLAFSANI